MSPQAGPQPWPVLASMAPVLPLLPLMISTAKNEDIPPGPEFFSRLASVNPAPEISNVMDGPNALPPPFFV